MGKLSNYPAKSSLTGATLARFLFVFSLLFVASTIQVKAQKSCGDGGTWGDPHIISIDGLKYDFQAVGEFVLLSSELGNLEIQVRQSAWRGSKPRFCKQGVCF